MASAVVDASVFISYMLDDEPEFVNEVEAIFTHIIDENMPLCAPHHFKLEVANVLLMSLRRKRIAPKDFQEKLIYLEHFPVTEHQPTLHQTAQLAQKHKLTLHDAAYLQTALDVHASAFYTFDKTLKKAAKKEGF